jgi:hypothetical protein
MVPPTWFLSELLFAKIELNSTILKCTCVENIVPREGEGRIWEEGSGNCSSQCRYDPLPYSLNVPVQFWLRNRANSRIPSMIFRFQKV